MTRDEAKAWCAQEAVTLYRCLDAAMDDKTRMETLSVFIYNAYIKGSIRGIKEVSDAENRSDR